MPSVVPCEPHTSGMMMASRESDTSRSTPPPCQGSRSLHASASAMLSKGEQEVGWQLQLAGRANLPVRPQQQHLRAWSWNTNGVGVSGALTR